MPSNSRLSKTPSHPRSTQLIRKLPAGAQSPVPALVMHLLQNAQAHPSTLPAQPPSEPIGLEQPPSTPLSNAPAQISPPQVSPQICHNHRQAQPHWRIHWFRPTTVSLGLIAMLLSSCNALGSLLSDRPEPPINLQLHQQWHLQPGQTIADYPISSGLGDVVIRLGGKAIYMPKAGLVQPLAASKDSSPHDGGQCIAVSSPEIPAYRLRLCHLRQQQLGYQPEGQVIGRGEQVAIAMLRKQPEGTWAFVDPSASLLEALLNQP